MKILIVEDQKYPLETLIFSIKKIFNEYCLTIIKCFNDAKKEIEKESSYYDVIFLDHRLPYNDLGNLEDEDFDKFSESLEYIGYKLIETIKRKHPNTVVIGTSSEKNRAVQYGTPDFNITKQDKKVVIKDLEKIYNNLQKRRIRNMGDRKTVVLISYNSVEGFKSGWHGKNRVYICANDNGRGRDTGEGRNDKERAQSVMHNISGNYYHGSVPIENIERYIVYSGLNALESAIYMAKDLKKQSNVPTTVVACNCSWSKKRKLLSDTDIHLMGCECGGRKTMGKITQEALS